MCLGDTGTVGACPTGCTAQCATITTNFRAGVAADAVKNLSMTICATNDDADTTVVASSSKACVVADTATFCSTLVGGGCSSAAFGTDCPKIVNGLKGTGTAGAAGTATLGRKALNDCIQDPMNGLSCDQCLAKTAGKQNP
jgi:hypothetical protein